MLTESKTREVWRGLIDERVWMIGIYGIGGVGKTTLLKQVYTKLTTTSPLHFDTVIWVTVSRNLFVQKILDDIWRSMGVLNVEWIDKTFEEKAKAISEVLSKTKLVLLLDDIGEIFDLTKLGVPYLEENKCKVIFTSRSQDMCNRMGANVTVPIVALKREDAWELFTNKVGEHRSRDPKILELAQTMASTCQGLPMFLCTVARAMASKTTYHEWFTVVKALQFQVAEEGRKEYASALLQLCFDSLHREARTGLLYYSLFPEDFTILKNELIDFWICEHLLGHYHIHENILNLGYKTLDALVGACLLEEEQVNYVKLLDSIRDFALDGKNRHSMSSDALLLPAESREIGWVLPLRILIRSLQYYVPDNFMTFLFNHNPFIMAKAKFNPVSRSTHHYQVMFAQNIENSYQFVDSLTVLDLSNSGVEEIPREFQVWFHWSILIYHTHGYTTCL